LDWAPVQDTHGGKPIVDFNGTLAFAELALLRICQRAGWQGVWVDTFRRKFRRDYWDGENNVALPSPQQDLLTHIYQHANLRSGCWDVFCWKADQLLFIEAKRQRRDKIRPSQVVWLSAALQCDIPLDSFLIVEWTFQTTEPISRPKR